MQPLEQHKQHEIAGGDAFMRETVNMHTHRERYTDREKHIQGIFERDRKGVLLFVDVEFLLCNGRGEIERGRRRECQGLFEKRAFVIWPGDRTRGGKVKERETDVDVVRAGKGRRLLQSGQEGIRTG